MRRFSPIQAKPHATEAGCFGDTKLGRKKTEILPNFFSALNRFLEQNSFLQICISWEIRNVAGKISRYELQLRFYLTWVSDGISILTWSRKCNLIAGNLIGGDFEQLKNAPKMLSHFNRAALLKKLQLTFLVGSTKISRFFLDFSSLKFPIFFSKLMWLSQFYWKILFQWYLNQPNQSLLVEARKSFIVFPIFCHFRVIFNVK